MLWIEYTCYSVTLKLTKSNQFKKIKNPHRARRSPRGSQLFRITTILGKITSLALVHSSHVLVGRHNVIDLVKLERGEKVRTLNAEHTDSIDRILVAGDSRYVATLSTDKRFRLWHFDPLASIGDNLKLLTELTFHCALRVGAMAENLGVILIGAESAAPLALLSLNEALRSEIRRLTPDVDPLPPWETIIPHAAAITAAGPLVTTATVDEFLRKLEQTQLSEDCLRKACALARALSVVSK